MIAQLSNLTSLHLGYNQITEIPEAIASELMIEILSAGKLHEQRDKETKRKLYSLYGVQEYWVVNWQLKTIEIYRRNQAQLELVCTLLGNDTLSSPLLPEFAVNVSKVFT